MSNFFFGRGPVAQSILGRIVLIILYASVWAILLAWLFLLGQPAEPVALKFAVVSAIGIGAGYLARRQLRGHSLTLSFLSALVAIIAGLAVLNPITRGFLGMNLLGLFPSTPEWDGLLQFCVAGLTAWLALRSWAGEPAMRTVAPRPAPARTARPARTTHPARTPRPAKPVRAASVRRPAKRAPAQPRAAAAARRPTVSAARVSISQLRERAGRRLRTTLKPLGSILAAPKRILAGNHSGPATKRKTQSRKRRLPGSTLRVRKSRGVQLSRMVEHRCPYCLEPVLANDSRGIKVCEVCHTRHHADCWAITGVCQVPHQNN
jgi:pyruvate/2-oxoglutarate dehydrogenase complex dihydrolipoamide acyltransferase (E2) component